MVICIQIIELVEPDGYEVWYEAHKVDDVERLTPELALVGCEGESDKELEGEEGNTDVVYDLEGEVRLGIIRSCDVRCCGTIITATLQLATCTKQQT